WLVAPEPTADLRPIVHLATLAAEAEPDSGYNLLVRGMAEYRAGDTAEALRWLDRPSRNTNLLIACLSGYFSAMAQHRLGHPEQAHASLSAANNSFNTFLQKGILGDPTLWPPFDSVAAIVIRAEAEQLILGREVSPRPTTESLAVARKASWNMNTR